MSVPLMQRKGHKMGIMFIYLHIFLKLRGFFFWTDTERVISGSTCHLTIVARPSVGYRC